MSQNNQQNAVTPSSGKWTVMVYMGSDDANSPLFVEQVKAMTDAGYHKDVEVLVYFDPHEPGVPTSLFNVNHKRKQEHPNQVQVGDGEDSFVRDLARDMVADLPRAMRDESEAATSFASFLDYCLGTGADHYVLIVVGHGLIVGNDAFLPDENPKSGITLLVLEDTLRRRFGSGKAQLELLALHSCAMAAIEVVYQLKDIARYMIASEGLAFVMGWQYRQVLKRLFKGLNRGDRGNDTVEEIVEDLHWLTFFSARDFLLAGYPLELALCTPDGAKLDKFTKDFGTLVRLLREGLANGEATDAIQLAHLKSQSYFGEEYTDLFDFCLCLAEKCTDRLGALRDACHAVIEKLEPVKDNRGEVKRPDNLVVRSRHWGWSTQYSHGLSIYFPWSQPVKRNGNTGMKSYEHYAFTKALGDDSWWNFLNDYFRVTQRETRKNEDRGDSNPSVDLTDFNKDLDIADSGFLQALDDATFREKPTGGLEKPTGGSEKPTGGSSDCDCPWIKNYPRKWWT